MENFLQTVTSEQERRLRKLGFDWCDEPPTVALALKWFRDTKKYNINFSIEDSNDKDKPFYCSVFSDINFAFMSIKSKTYDESEFHLLNMCLKWYEIHASEEIDHKKNEKKQTVDEKLDEAYQSAIREFAEPFSDIEIQTPSEKTITALQNKFAKQHWGNYAHKIIVSKVIYDVTDKVPYIVLKKDVVQKNLL